MIVEPYEELQDNTEFTVTVLGTAKGPVALLPTEVTWYDFDEDLEQNLFDEEEYIARKKVRLCYQIPLSVSVSSEYLLLSLDAFALSITGPQMMVSGASLY